MMSPVSSERGSGGKPNAIPVFTENVFGFVTGTAFALRAESRSPSHRNAVRLPTGIAFDFTGIGTQIATWTLQAANVRFIHQERGHSNASLLPVT